MSKSLIRLFVLFTLITPTLGQGAQAQQLEVTPFKKSAIYELGEAAGWTIEVPGRKIEQAGEYAYAVKKNYFDVIKAGNLKFSFSKATVAPGPRHLQSASPPYPLQQRVSGRAAEGWLEFNVELHDVLPDQPPSYYEALPDSPPANNGLVAASTEKSGLDDSHKANKAVRAAARTDANSMLAHRQLIEKAKQGSIDLYFVGDSITRRWGCTDPQYSELLANWKKNFFGWNAGNFGWGGDTTENILWRLENGELDGVHPKVIVILAGTNNLSEHRRRDAQVEKVTSGIKAIVDVCQQKAPAATIIVTAILPRNDKAALMPTIDQINGKVKKFADGKQIRVLNVNNKLADSDGKLRGGVTVDKLHLTVKGYQIWADGLKPIITELLGPPAITDHAPPPTGDPSATRASN